MACSLASEFLCTSISNLRVAEDAIGAVLITFIAYTLLITARDVVREGPLMKRLNVMVIGLVPFMAWKILGATRRIFVEKSNPIYTPMHDFGEVMEALSALFILASLIYLFLLVRPKKVDV